MRKFFPFVENTSTTYSLHNGYPNGQYNYIFPSKSELDAEIPFLQENLQSSTIHGHVTPGKKKYVQQKLLKIKAKVI